MKTIFNNVINVEVLKMFAFAYLHQMFSHVLHLYNLTCAPRKQNMIKTCFFLHNHTPNFNGVLFWCTLMMFNYVLCWVESC